MNPSNLSLSLVEPLPTSAVDVDPIVTYSKHTQHQHTPLDILMSIRAAAAANGKPMDALESKLLGALYLLSKIIAKRKWQEDKEKDSRAKAKVRRTIKALL